MIKSLTRRAVQMVIVLAAVVGSRAALADEPQRIWILPFEPLHADPSTEYLKEALPALLTMAVSQSDAHIVVDRQVIDELLEELSLTLEGLVSSDDRHRIGRLLGATVMITGSYTQQHGKLVVTMRATDLETGMVRAASSVNGSADEPRELVDKLIRAARATFGRRSPDRTEESIDRAPLANLHFMKGLGHYFSARYSQAVAEFIRASDEDAVNGTARLWLAKTYMADRQYGHAYLELIWLTQPGATPVAENDLAATLRACERHLTAGEIRRIRELVRRRAEPPPGDVVVESDPGISGPYRFGGNRTAIVPLSIRSAQMESLVMRADLVQLTAMFAVPVLRDLEVPVHDIRPGSVRIASELALLLPAVKRETEFELRFRSRRQGQAEWQSAGRIAVRAYP